ncbi:ABC transporter ATP-binding protein [Robinsoniella peoriensis]|uniref:Lipid A export ATP-binding/permease protein MsbA n=1 Tax=Robinsoniella peoriensis TaxID=180332 RepID=A0A4U8Q181_9FIRM|nr:ABC transporter ATP-binding protein [Robinsoniella peoriensis]TLC98420.1 Lipid A export ATP-binding/permease protein MsbA [Robinsoniella peoriensis]
MTFLKSFFLKNKGKSAIMLLLLLGQVAGTLYIPFLIAGIVDKGIMKEDMNAILSIGIQMLIAAVITTAVAVLGSFYSADLAAAFGRDMRNAVFCKSQELSLREFDSIGVSSMITRTTSDISVLQQSLGMIFQLVVPAPLMVIASVIMTAKVNLSLTLIPVLCIVFFLILAWIILKKSGPLSAQIQLRMDNINQVVRESITGIRVIRAFDNGTYEQHRCDKAFSRYADNMIKLNKLFALLNPTVWLVMGLSMAAIVWFGGLMSLKGTMQIGEITAVTEYTIMTLGYLIMAALSSVTLPKMKSCLDRLEEVLHMTPEIKDAQMKNSSSLQNGPAVQFEHVTFSYHGAEEPVLQDLSFSCYAGKTTAIIGGTGSGKSTIANLMLRLHDINSGKISLNGTDIRTMSQEKLRENIGYVPQKAFLFSGTIADNLRMGCKTATKMQMRKALRISQAEHFVDGLHNGLNAPVSQSGSNFSGGQKQRLSIARALIKESPVLIFDDSFSALDFKTDVALRRALKKETPQTAKLIIAQRISTIMDADQIIVLDEGKIAGIGKHTALMQNCQVYQAIAKSQLSSEEVTAV